MVVTLRRNLTDPVLELGGGSNPHVNPRCKGGNDVNCDVRDCVDTNGNPTTDFTADFNEPLPISSDEFSAVFSHFVIEHLSWRKVRQFVSEMFRVTKPGGKVVTITANTEAQTEYIKAHPEGWDNKDDFDSFSCNLFGDQDYPDNAHKNFMSPKIAQRLFTEAGFINILIQPYGTASTDICIEAYKPGNIETNGTNGTITHPIVSTAPARLNFTREELFDRHYFNGGKKVGGYAREGYWDFPVHELTFRHILDRKPESALEIGSSRGYLVKRLQDSGIKAQGIDISTHCYLTRACEDLITWDLCHTPWPVGNKEFDLCFGIGILDHIPEEHLPKVISEIKRVSKRGLFGIDFDPTQEGDLTRVTIHPAEWWKRKFSDENYEIALKADLERGVFPEEVLRGDNKVKLNIGSLNLMFHHGWVNIDILDLTTFSEANRFRFQKLDIRNGLPYPTGGVDLINCSHCLEHLTYSEGLSFLRECRRVIKPTGVMRLSVPDGEMLMERYKDNNFDEFNEVNDECAEATSSAKKLWALLYNGHNSVYDETSLGEALRDSGWLPRKVKFREGHVQLIKECLESFPCLSLTYEASPHVV